MKRFALLLVAVAMLAVALPVAAGAADTYTFGFSGRNADAWSSTGDQMGAGAWSSVGAFGGAITSKQVGTDRVAKMRTIMGFVNVEEFTPATTTEPAVLRSLWLHGDPALFSANRDLTSATLDFVGIGEMATWTGVMPWDAPDGWRDPDTTVAVTAGVEVDWTGEGPLWRESYSSKSRTDGFFSIDRSNSTRRAAEAVGLIVGSDGTVYFDGAFSDASIYDTRGTGHMKGQWPY